ncbi:MAG: alpha/beta hydrolase family esterase [Chloroflexota bacterium]
MKRAAFVSLILSVTLLACARNISQVTDPTLTLTVDGLERSYILHAPDSYDGRRPVPLVLDFHGGGGDATNQWRVSDFDQLADQEGFIVAYPNGTGRLGDKVLTWNGGACCGYAMTNNIDDVAFIRALVAHLQASYNIDPKRIYATGLSNGGIMSYRLACEASDLFAAIGPVAGTLNYKRCEPSQAVSVIHFHGTNDSHLPYEGGYGPDSVAGVLFASVKDSIDFWLAANQCLPTSQIESFADIQHEIYVCAQGTAVELYTIIGGKHAWPGSSGPAWRGGDEPTQTISATKLMWEFFANHPKP